MITEPEMMNVLLGACPSFARQWDVLLKDWANEPDGVPLYIGLGEFSRHLIEKLQRTETDDLRRIFALIEQLNLEGDDSVKEAATIGILENLQNGNLHRGTQPEQFRPFLGLESTKWWDKLYRFWENGEILSDD